MGGNDFDKLSLVALANSARTNNTLQALSLKNSSLGADSCIEIGNFLRTSQSIKDLDLSQCSLSSSEGKRLGDGLSSNRSLTTLNISSNSKLGEGFVALIQTLHGNAISVITKLFADNVGAGDAGALRMGDILRSNTTLERISLKDNGISNMGAENLFNGLQTNKTLIFLSLEKNDITPNPKFMELKNSVSKTRAISLK